MKEILANLIEMSGIYRGVKAQTPEGLMVQGLALLLTRETLICMVTLQPSTRSSVCTPATQNLIFFLMIFINSGWLL